MSNKKQVLRLPLVPVKDIVVFPYMIISLFIGRDKSLNAINKVTKDSNHIIIATQKDSEKNEVNIKDIRKVGVLVEILQIIKMPDTSMKLVVRGISRVNIESIIETDLFEAEYSVKQDIKKYDETKLKDIKEDLLNNFTNYINISKKVSQSLLVAIKKVENVEEIVYLIASHLPINDEEKQRILEMDNLLERIAYINSILEVELDLISVEKKIRDRVKKQMEKNQKDYYLNEQIKAIQKELNNGEELKDEIKELLAKAHKTKLSAEAKEKVESEIRKLSFMNPISAEATVVRNYLDFVLGIPWNTNKANKIDVNKAGQYLAEEHYALTKVKERILEYIAVLKKSSKIKAPILCLVGPPGVGKTSLAKSIAKASGREFVRISLGGVKDESEIRGHRRTYIGAMPGKIIQAMKKVKVSNPLILLDEIDKMSSDFRGDPASALLEVLDKEQNNNFVDHYIEVGYDLSNVMFITTANSLNMQEALVDRMEIIELTGYSEEEKLEIAKIHLLPKKIEEAALTKDEFKISDDAVVSLIRNYTRESGVRKLEEAIGSVTRKVAKEIVVKSISTADINVSNLQEYAGIAKYKDSQLENKSMVGVTTGLAWTRVGGDILYIEALKLPGTGDVKITGKIGEIMQESVKAAYSLLFSNADVLGIDKEVFKTNNIHIHVPEGATPKDGPSAGVAMLTSMYSVLTGKKVRVDTAMTGEITLRGRVLPIGGVREKLLAALRMGIKNIIIPYENEKDLSDLPKTALNQLNIIKVSQFSEVLKNAIDKNEEKNKQNA